MNIRKGDELLIMMDVRVYQDSAWRRWLGVRKVERQRRRVRVDEIKYYRNDPVALVTFEYEGMPWIPCLWSNELRALMREACPYALGDFVDSITI